MSLEIKRNRSEKEEMVFRREEMNFITHTCIIFRASKRRIVLNMFKHT